MPRRVRGGRGSSVRHHDGIHDGQAEPAAAGGHVSVGARGVRPPEPVEHLRHVTVAEAGTVVGHHDQRVASVRAHGNFDRRPCRCVVARVGQEVGEDLSQPCVVAGDDGRPVRLQGHGAFRFDGTGIAHRIGRHQRQVDRSAVQRAALIETRQQEQVVDKASHPSGFILDAGDGLGRTDPDTLAEAVLGKGVADLRDVQHIDNNVAGEAALVVEIAADRIGAARSSRGSM